MSEKTMAFQEDTSEQVYCVQFLVLNAAKLPTGWAISGPHHTDKNRCGREGTYRNIVDVIEIIYTVTPAIGWLRARRPHKVYKLLYDHGPR